jgi:FkbM family methyltransferase
MRAKRAARRNPLVERVQCALRRETGVSFPEIELFVPCGPDDIIIDAGANVGDITSRCARTGATVHAFEPNPHCYALLTKRFSYMPNVKLHNAGVMDRSCSLVLESGKPYDDYDVFDTSLSSSFFSTKTGELDQMEVDCIDLAAFIKALGKPVALLKMDIEASEIPVLNHLIDTSVIDLVGIVIVETHERLSPEIARQTAELRHRIAHAELEQRVRLDWI